MNESVDVEPIATSTAHSTPADEAPARGPVKSAVRTLEILELLSGPTARMTVASMARELEIPKSSLHGILRTMEAQGWLETDASGTQFGLGIRALLTGNAYVENDALVSLAQPILDSLSDQIGEAIHLGRLDDDDVVYLAKRESLHALRLYSAVGRRLPAHATALGKSILATLTDDEIERRLSWPLASLTAHTITDKQQLMAQLHEVRRKGYAFDDGENTIGICCIAVALAPRGRSRDAVSCSIPIDRVTDEQVQEVVRAITRSVQLLDTLVARLDSDK